MHLSMGIEIKMWHKFVAQKLKHLCIHTSESAGTKHQAKDTTELMKFKSCFTFYHVAQSNKLLIYI